MKRTDFCLLLNVLLFLSIFVETKAETTKFTRILPSSYKNSDLVNFITTSIDKKRAFVKTTDPNRYFLIYDNKYEKFSNIFANYQVISTSNNLNRFLLYNLKDQDYSLYLDASGKKVKINQSKNSKILGGSSMLKILYGHTPAQKKDETIPSYWKLQKNNYIKTELKNQEESMFFTGSSWDGKILIGNYSSKGRKLPFLYNTKTTRLVKPKSFSGKTQFLGRHLVNSGKYGTEFNYVNSEGKFIAAQLNKKPAIISYFHLDKKDHFSYKKLKADKHKIASGKVHYISSSGHILCGNIKTKKNQTLHGIWIMEDFLKKLLKKRSYSFNTNEDEYIFVNIDKIFEKHRTKLPDKYRVHKIVWVDDEANNIWLLLRNDDGYTSLHKLNLVRSLFEMFN